MDSLFAVAQPAGFLVHGASALLPEHRGWSPNLEPKAQTLNPKNRRLRRSQHGLALKPNPKASAAAPPPPPPPPPPRTRSFSPCQSPHPSPGDPLGDLPGDSTRGTQRSSRNPGGVSEGSPKGLRGASSEASRAPPGGPPVILEGCPRGLLGVF